MSQITTHTRGLCSWRDRLADPGRQWKRKFSAFETAVSWENASARESGLPRPIETLFKDTGFSTPDVLIAVAEHKVPLSGGISASQCDVWAILKTAQGLLSLTVEAKANESFGDDILENWLVAGKTDRSIANRKSRWKHIYENLPISDSYMKVRYQILHRCAAAVIEARRWGCPNAAFVVQAFGTPHGQRDANFEAYQDFCASIHLEAIKGSIAHTKVGDIALSVGWVDCPLATDAEVAACASGDFDGSRAQDTVLG